MCPPASPHWTRWAFPPVLKELAFLQGGLVLAVGSAGSGKTTTLAALLDHRNAHASGHILTIEDPIEYLHHHQKSLVTQREVGLDTRSYDEALRRAASLADSLLLQQNEKDEQSIEDK